MGRSILTRVFGVFFGAILLGALIGWWASQNPTLPESIAETAVQEVTIPDATPVPSPRVRNIPVIPAPAAMSEISEEDSISQKETWEEYLDEILASEADATEKAEHLLEMMPGVDDEAQIELGGHIANLLDDAHYAPIAAYVTNAAVSYSLVSVFLNNLDRRKNSLKLPLVLAVARDENHPLRDEAKDMLRISLNRVAPEDDHGPDWVAWESSVNTWLTEHPDEDR